MSDAAELYERDFYAWTRTQARELRRFAATRPNVPLDLPHLAEEIADLGTEQRAKLRRWTVGIIERLLLLGQASAVRRDAVGDILDFRGSQASIDRSSSIPRSSAKRAKGAIEAPTMRSARETTQVRRRNRASQCRCREWSRSMPWVSSLPTNSRPCGISSA